MPLAMSRPWKHPKTGIYQLRKAVPKELRELIGKREEKVSLETRDPAEAKQRFAKALAELEARWANLRAGPKSLTELEAHQLAIVAHDRWLEQHRDNPSQQTSWDIELGGRLFGPRKPLKSLLADLERSLDFSAPQSPDDNIFRMESWCLQAADDCLAVHGLVVDDQSRRTLARAIAAAVQRASLTLAELAKGEVITDSLFVPVVASSRAPISRTPQQPIPFQKLLDGWAAERRPVAKTVYEWTRVIRELEKHLGHTDAHRLTSEDLVEWKQSMVAAGLRSKTIQGAKLSPVRAVLQWGVRNKLIAANAAEGISLDVRAKHAEKKRGYSDDEARIVLRAALAEADPVKRWVPWIGAYTGARISEICQLRREDVVEVEGIWCFKFVPEAGSLKTSGSERIVPLHPALIEGGLLKFVSGAKSKSLFADLPPDKFGKQGGNGTKLIGRFVRQLGLKDPRLSPSHSWRHRIKTMGRKYGLASDLMNAITGHQAASVGDSYGHHPVDALFRELCKIPALKI
ncbi:MAG: DUF6538 domain-containing protein [Bradyrhizobium sp.]|uniref:DUF6538 domain-containing protein n=1 Tax=Bradyrhizobium sp. TaxID=376 RepID=UPI003D12CBBB